MSGGPGTPYPRHGPAPGRQPGARPQLRASWGAQWRPTNLRSAFRFFPTRDSSQLFLGLKFSKLLRVVSSHVGFQPFFGDFDFWALSGQEG